MLYGGPIVSDW